LKVNTRPYLFDDPYLQILEVSAPGVPAFLVFNIYNERYGNTQQYTVERLLQDYTFPITRVLLVGDLNAHHSWWNSQVEEERRASTLVQKMEEGNFALINDPDTPTFFQYRKTTNTIYESVLDLAFATGDLFEWIINWSICEKDTEETGSYHEMIRFEVMHNGTPLVPSPTTQRYNWKKAD